MMIFLLFVFIKSKIYDNFDQVEYKKRLIVYGNVLNEAGRDIFQNINDFKSLNILILGKTGSGKSTLINNIFHDKLSKTGDGHPITQDIYPLTKRQYPLTIYDTPGLILDEKKQISIQKEIYNLIQKQVKNKGPNKYIHCIWYCVNCATNRFEDSEIQFIKKISSFTGIGKVPIILILTQCYNNEDKNKMIKELIKSDIDIDNIIPIVAKKKKLLIPESQDHITISPYGFDELFKVMENKLPEMLKETLTNYQNVLIGKKKTLSMISVAVGTFISIIIFLSPNPKYILLVPTNVIMLWSITYIYGIEIPLELIFKITSFAGENTDKVGKIAQTIIFIYNYLTKVTILFVGMITGSLGYTFSCLVESAYIKQIRAESIPLDEIKNNVHALFHQYASMQF